MPNLNTPRSLDEITTAWLSAALTAGGAIPEATLLDSRFETIGEDVGFTSILVRAHLSFDRDHPDLPASVIIKMPTADPRLRQIVMELELFDRENTFFAKYPVNGPGKPPRHYYSVADRENDDYVLMMEDLGQARFVSQVEGADARDAEAVVRTLGRVHAAHWDNETIAAMDWLPTFQAWADLIMPTFEEGTPKLIENFGYLLPSGFQAHIDAGTAAYQSVVDYMLLRPNSLVHIDARIENFAFEAGTGPDSVRFFDWQSVTRGPAVYDLSYFLGGSVDPGLRRSLGEKLEAAYHSELIAGGVQDFSMEDLRHTISVTSCLLFGFLSQVGSAIEPDEAGRTLMGAMVPRMVEFLRDYDAVETLKNF